ncbi:MAG: tripartite tricarboxylate transporter substrate binding protein [Alcaligenaceae bacterium]|jgi:tripartite-type tricarboxylate transporter receptor subunit TctC
MRYFSGFTALRAGLALLLLFSTAWTQAQTWPTRSIRLVIPFAPGGGTDILARVIAPKLSEVLGQQVVVENKPGASSIIGSQIVVQAAPDGYTVMMVDSSIYVNPGLRTELPYNTMKDLTPLVHMAVAPVILVVHPSVQAQTLAELIALGKAKPESLLYGSGGNGSSPHMAGELFNIASGVAITHVPYKGTGEALSAVLAGQVPLTYSGISSVRQAVEAGRLRALALTGAQRNAALPNVPTFVESGLPTVDCSSHWGMLGPAGMAPEIVAKFNTAVNQVLADVAIKERIAALGYDVAGGPPEAYTKLLNTEIEKWRQVIKTAGIKAN